MAPVNAAVAFVGLAMLPDVFRSSPANRVRTLTRTAAVLAALSVMWGAILLVLPRAVGELLLGATWDAARSVLPWTIVEYVGMSIALVAILGLQVLQRVRVIAVWWVASSLVTAVAVVIAATVGTSVVAVAQVLAVMALVDAAAVAVAYYRCLRQPARPGERV
jgi:hypothetical protein